MILFALLLAACDEQGPAPEPVEFARLVNHTMWTQAPVADDPFADRRPADWVCDPAGMRSEWLGPDEVFEIETGRCDHVTVVQPSLAELRAGDEIDVRLWHYELASPDPDAKGYAGIAIGGEIVWSYEVAIPSPSNLAKETIVLEHDAPIGTPIHYFVGNHGINQWELIDIDRAGE